MVSSPAIPRRGQGRQARDGGFGIANPGRPVQLHQGGFQSGAWIAQVRGLPEVAEGADGVAGNALRPSVPVDCPHFQQRRNTASLRALLQKRETAGHVTGHPLAAQQHARHAGHRTVAASIRCLRIVAEGHRQITRQCAFDAVAENVSERHHCADKSRLHQLLQ